MYHFFVVFCALVLVCSAQSSERGTDCSSVNGRCPPGFVALDEDNCVCESELNRGALPIERCDEHSCRAHLRNGYWAGYLEVTPGDDGTNISRLELYTGKCPRGFCESGGAGEPLLLPGLSSGSNLTEELNEVVCGKTRKGRLCGECSPGYGPGINLFLAPCVHCATDPLSQVGWLLWLLLEALPMLLMLAAFLIFDINLLAGPLNSYLFYAQFIAASFPISSIGPIVINDSANSVIIRFLYVFFFGIFNLQFFTFLFPPFCISPSAANLDQLDIILIKALTRLLPFVIILAIIALQWCNQYGYCGVPKCWQRLSQRYKAVHWLTGRLSGQSAAHGLSALFILVYTRFLSYGGVLCDGNVLEPSSTSNASAIAVLELQGNLAFFQAPKHTVITIFILLVIVFMILLPTCLLLVYPALPQLQDRMQNSKYKILHNISRQKCLNIFSRTSIQHFADLFQSSYKDNCRFFAGLLLLVRIVVVVAWNISGSQENGYVLVTALSLAVLALHSLLRPHQSAWINVVDSLLYTHLTATNLLAVYIYSNPDSPRSLEDSWTTLYLFALFAPGAYLVLYLAYVLHKRWRRLRRRQPPAAAADTAVGDDYVYVEHVVEVDPKAEEDPAISREREQEMEASFGNIADKSSGNNELWFGDN